MGPDDIKRLRQRNVWTQEDLANALKQRFPGTRVSAKYLSALESGRRNASEKLTSKLKLLYDERDRVGGSPPANSTIKMSFGGAWAVEALDIEVPGELEYGIEPKRWSATVTLEHGDDGAAVVGRGRDRLGAPVVIEARFEEAKMYSTARYWVESPLLTAFGVIFLKYNNSSTNRSLKGYYIARATGHDTDFAFGRLVMKKIANPDDEGGDLPS